MAEKDETKETLLTTLTNDRMGVPTRRDEREVELREHVEPSREREAGKPPEEVVEQRERRPTPTVKGEKPEAPKKWKVSVDDGSGESVVQELTLEQIAERGLLERLITTAGQFPTIQRKYQDLLERTAGKEPVKATETQPAKPEPPTQAQIRQHYTPLLQQRVAAGYLEADFAEAYPDLATNLVYWSDIIETINERLGATDTKLSSVVEWIRAEAEMRNAVKVMDMLNAAIEAVAVKGDGEKGDPLFKDLRDQDVRANFMEWLRTEVDPKVGSLTKENIEKFWFAFNAKGILNITKEVVQRANEPSPKRRAAGDGSSARLGGRETPKEKTLLERMSETRLGPEA